MGVSWAVWGFSYFATFFLNQVIFLDDLAYTGIWAFASILVSPYIIYSVCYQWKVIKQWCPLCLGIQAVLLLNASAAVFFLSYSSFSLSIGWHTVYTTVALSTGFLLLGYHMVPVIKQARDSKDYERRWKRLRFHPDIFQAILAKGNQISIPPQGFGISFGNPSAKNEIIKVCNPYCGPCSRAHPVLEHIVENNPDVKVRIIFKTFGRGKDPSISPVKHLLAIREKYGENMVKQALDEWYLAERKDYEAFAKKYPMNGALNNQGAEIIAMNNWCDEMKVRATPTLFINGYEYPEDYRINELKHLF